MLYLVKGVFMDKQKLKVVFFVVFLILGLILALLSIVLKSTILLIVFIICAIFVVFIGYLLTKENKTPLTELLEYHKLKENLLQQKMQTQKQYLKRQISEKQFNILSNSLDKQILLLDYKIMYIDAPLDQEQDLKRIIKFLQKKYFKHEIPEELYNSMQSQFSKELAKLKTDTKKKNASKKK